MKEYWLIPNMIYAIKHVRRANILNRFVVSMGLGSKPLAKCMARNEMDAADQFRVMGFEFGYYSPHTRR